MIGSSNTGPVICPSNADLSAIDPIETSKAFELKYISIQEITFKTSST